MDEFDFNNLCKSVVDEMTGEISRFITPISRTVEPDYGVLAGSGSYIQSNGHKFLLTDEHVVSEGKNEFGHQFKGCDCIFKLTHHVAEEKEPVDLAIYEIKNDSWENKQCEAHFSEAIPLARFALSHRPVESELLYIQGYPGIRSKVLHEILLTTSTSMLTQQTNTGTELNTQEFELIYDTDKGERIDGSTLVLPIPNGMSGSLVWNTRRVEYLKENKQWSPSDAVVTGIVCRWVQSSNSIICNGVETINRFLETHI